MDGKVNSASVSNENSFEKIIHEARNRGDVWFIAEVDGESMGREIGSDSQVPVKLLPTDYPYKIGDTIVFRRGSRFIIHKIFDSYVYNQKEYFVTGGVNQITNEKVDSSTVSRSDIVGIPDLSTEAITGTQDLMQQGTLIYITVNAITNEFEGRLDRIGTKLNKLISREMSKGTYDISTLAQKLFPTSDSIIEFLGMRKGGPLFKTEFLPRLINFLEATYNIGDIKGIRSNDLEFLKNDLLDLCFNHFFKKGLTTETLKKGGASRDIISLAESYEMYLAYYNIYETQFEVLKETIDYDNYPDLFIRNTNAKNLQRNLLWQLSGGRDFLTGEKFTEIYKRLNPNGYSSSDFERMTEKQLKNAAMRFITRHHYKTGGIYNKFDCRLSQLVL
jgi:hypothetical protein